MKKIGAIEVRVSTDVQVEYSPDSQIKICLEYAEKHNIHVPPENIYRDDGISGRSAKKRSEFMRMISDAQKDPRPFDVVLIYSFSRFARNKYEAVLYKHLLRDELGIEVISVTQPLPDTPDRVLLESLYEGMDEQYSLNLAKESMRGKKEKADRGEHMGHAPFGYWYDKNTKTLRPKKHEASIVKTIFDKYLAPDGSLNNVAKYLNKVGIKTKRGNQWNPECVKYLLKNPVYIGQTRFCLGGYKLNKTNTDVIAREGKHEKIVSIETWEKVQRKIADNDEIYLKDTISYVKHEYWLRGLIKCSNCGKNLVMIERKSGRKRKPFLQCNWYNKHLCNKSHQILYEIFENAVLEELKRTFTDKLDVNVVSSEERLDEVSLLETSITKQEAKLERVKLAYENGIDTLEEYKEKKSRLEEELHRLRDELEKAKLDNTSKEQKEKVYQLCNTAYETLIDPQIEFEIKYKIAHDLIDHIVFDKENSTIYITYRA